MKWPTNKYVFYPSYVGLIIGETETKLDKKIYNKIKNKHWRISSGSKWPYVKGGKTYLHRLITECPVGKVVDHINGDTLDNRLKNLRVCSQSENCQNRRGGIRGITMFGDLYRVKIHKDYKQIHLGYFKTIEEAQKARISAEKVYFTKIK